ncbi:hypothetical protein GOL75_14345 [Sinorhizobium medicae]|nr:hypothetical protein [Sinorhizobium medicae]MDX1162497.1 hypothetical protein [Sinorhizobium medicae]
MMTSSHTASPTPLRVRFSQNYRVMIDSVAHRWQRDNDGTSLFLEDGGTRFAALGHRAETALLSSGRMSIAHDFSSAVVSWRKIRCRPQIEKGAVQ